MDAHTDQELWLEVKRNNKLAFDELVVRYWKFLYNSAYKRVQSEPVCQDIIQDVFTDLWIRREALDIEHPKAYLHTAVRFQVFKYFSRNKVSDGFLGLFDGLTDRTTEADAWLKYKELKDLLQAWINTLPAKRREIYRLYYEEELSTKEIAGELSISQKTVQNQLNTALKSLKTKLSGTFLFFFL